MKDMLAEQYELIIENERKGTVNTPGMAKPGQDMIDKGADKAPGRGVDSPAAKNVPSPKEMDKNKNPGHDKITEEKEIDDMLPESKFDRLFKSKLFEDAFGADDESPLEQTGEDEFNDEMGDFEPNTGDEDLGEEVDVATEIRLIIDRLTEVAEKLGAYEDEESEEGEFGEEGMEGEEPEFGEDGMEGAPVPESVTYGKGGQGKAGGPGKGSDGKLGSFPDRAKTMQSKSSMKVKSSSVMGKQTGKGKGGVGGPGKGSDGKLKSFPDRAKSMQSKSNMTVKSEMGKVGRSVFD